ncbi:MAG TPA: ATP-binding protein, partial [Polyangiaceae bacterium]|nr:ATP-binding protein [Polyangiaceae bacterium]
DLRAVIKEAADAARSLLDKRGVTFSLELEPRPLYVDGDPARLQQIHVNLLSNAAKYTPRGGHVSLVAGREDGRAVVRVRDDGAGIPPVMLESVFDLFVQSARTLDRSDGGIGVGLTLVRSLVGMHGGEVSAHSEGEGRGSEFVVRLPLAAAEAAEAPAGARPFASRGGAATVVLVEDNADSREMMCHFLELAGFNCHSAGDGVEGLALIRRVHPDVALIDVGLPGMDGFAIARHVRDDPAHAGTYLIAVTGYGQPADRARAIDAGFDAHVVKPVQPESLLRLLSEDRPAPGASAARPAAPGPRPRPASPLDAPGARADGHVTRPDGQDPRVDGTGLRPDGQGARVDGTGLRPDGQGVRVDGMGLRPDGQGVRVDGHVLRPDVHLTRVEGRGSGG